eukprot:12912017-Prorocentrum_lima.AAC.1
MNEDYSIKITCVQLSKKLGIVRLSPERKRQVNEPFTKDEAEQLMSVVESLMWIRRSCRPGIAYAVSKLQSIMRKASVVDLIFANK